MLSCREATARASALLDDSLTRRERWGLQLHLMMCRNCRRYLDQLRLTVESLKRLSQSPIESATEVAHTADLARKLQSLAED